MKTGKCFKVLAQLMVLALLLTSCKNAADERKTGSEETDGYSESFPGEAAE